jgi:putative ABC transport system ATP-binding protein
VEDNVRAAVEPAPGDRRDLLASALLRLEAWGLAGRTRQLPSTLSGGERARVSLAVAMACSPPLLVLDEPTGEVDAVTETIMLDALERHCAEGGAILVSTHSAAVARRAYRSIKLSAGRIADA